MREESLKFLKRLIQTPSPSGYEVSIQKIIQEELSEICEEVRRDVLGNVIGVINKEGKPRIMLAGHCDEIGLMVKYISEEGFIYFTPIGGVDPHILPGRKVYIHTGKGRVTGVIGRKPIHLLEEEEKKKIEKIEKMWIDIGAKSKEEASERVSIGDPITFAEELENLTEDILAGRGFDDRIGAFLMVEIMRELAEEKISASLFGVSTVQEEVGLRGARPSTYAIHPDIGICLEVGFATDYPEVNKKKLGEYFLGEGPLLSRGPNINPVLFELLTQVAKEEGIKIQVVGEPRGTGTDANVMQLSREGVATCLVSIPLRYMHTPVELLSLKDVENTLKLITSFLKRLSPEVDLRPR